LWTCRQFRQRIVDWDKRAAIGVTKGTKKLIRKIEDQLEEFGLAAWSPIRRCEAGRPPIDPFVAAMIPGTAPVLGGTINQYGREQS
jgi:hypothetical protein